MERGHKGPRGRGPRRRVAEGPSEGLPTHLAALVMLLIYPPLDAAPVRPLQTGGSWDVGGGGSGEKFDTLRGAAAPGAGVSSTRHQKAACRQLYLHAPTAAADSALQGLIAILLKADAAGRHRFCAGLAAAAGRWGGRLASPASASRESRPGCAPLGRCCPCCRPVLVPCVCCHQRLPFLRVFHTSLRHGRGADGELLHPALPLRAHNCSALIASRAGDHGAE